MPKDAMFLYGKNSVFERLKTNPASIKKIFLHEDFNLPADIEKSIRQKNTPLERLNSRELARIKPTKDLQGIIARVDKFEYASLDDLLSRVASEQLTPIFLDRISDPQNLGVIIRSAACFGRFAVVIHKFEACEITEAVLHVASGGENYVPVAMVSNLTSALIAAKEAGYWIMGGVLSDDAQDINEISLPFPLGLVLGSEGEGIRYGVRKHLDLAACIPMRGARLSFNVAMACVIFCQEISKQREKFRSGVRY